MNARLFCKTGALAGSHYRIGEEATIGRWEDNDITLPSDAVSGQHARIFFDDETGCYVLEDLDSDNGTELDRTEVVDPIPLENLHIITFGQTVDFIFQAVSEGAASSAKEEEGAKTQFGMAESPTELPGEDGPEGERTRIGQAPGGLPDVPDEEPTSEKEEDPSEDDDRTRFGEAPPELPDFSEEDESEGEHTQYGGAPGTLPDLSDEDSASEQKEESPSEDEDRTQFGKAPPEPPDFSEETESGEEPEGERTRIGDAPGGLPDVPDEESASEQEGEGTPEDEDRTQFGEAPSELPDLSEEPSEAESDSEEEERTRMGADAPALPDLSEDEPSSEDEEEPADEPPSPAEAPTRAVPGQGPRPAEPSPQYVLQVVLEDEPQGTHSLPEGEVTIGRSSDCDIQIEDPGVSRQHARLIVESDEVVVEDMGSKNFTFVDGDRLSGPTPLSPGAEIQFGLQAKAVLQRASS